MEFPVEIRDRVYAFLLAPNFSYPKVDMASTPIAGQGVVCVEERDPLDDDPVAWKVVSYRSRKKFPLQLLRVSRQVFAEASCIFYGRNVFYFEKIDIVVPFLEDRPRLLLLKIKSLSIPLNPLEMNYSYGYAALGMSVTAHKYWALWELCMLLSDKIRLPRFLELDLRVEGGEDVHRFFGWEMMDKLAMVGDPKMMTVSNNGWFWEWKQGFLRPLDVLEEISQIIRSIRAGYLQAN